MTLRKLVPGSLVLALVLGLAGGCTNSTGASSIVTLSASSSDDDNQFSTGLKEGQVYFFSGAALMVKDDGVYLCFSVSESAPRGEMPGQPVSSAAGNDADLPAEQVRPVFPDCGDSAVWVNLPDGVTPELLGLSSEPDGWHGSVDVTLTMTASDVPRKATMKEITTHAE